MKNRNENEHSNIKNHIIIIIMGKICQIILIKYGGGGGGGSDGNICGFPFS